MDDLFHFFQFMSGSDMWYCGGFKYFLHFHPYLGKMNPIWRISDGLKPPTRCDIDGKVDFLFSIQPRGHDKLTHHGSGDRHPILSRSYSIFGRTFVEPLN